MKWERKKTSLLSHVFPISWLSKLKQMSNKSPLSQPAKTKRKSKPKMPVNSSSLPVCFKPSRLSESGRHLCPISSPQILDPRTGRDVPGFVEPEDDFWRFSFRKESFEWKKGNEIQVEDENSKSRMWKERRALSADFEGRQEKYQERGSRWVGRGISVAEEEKQPPGRKFSDYSSSSKNSNDPQIGSSGSRNSTHISLEEVPKFPPLNLRNSHRCRRSRDPPPKGQKQGNREPNRGKIKQRPTTPKTELFSPRIICKIRALEELKKKKKEGEERGIEFESFAVEKSSLDPQKDFRESMVEMISEKKIGGAEELENLLACYLSLNSSQYHDVIVKVFRQVWFDLNRECFVSELERGYYDY